MGTHAWLTGIHNITIVGYVVNKGFAMQKVQETLDKHQRENPDLHDVYERKKQLVRDKDYATKNVDDVIKNVQDLISELNEKYVKN